MYPFLCRIYDQIFEKSENHLQDKFWNSFSDANGIRFLKDELCIKISDSFLENNEELI